MPKRNYKKILITGTVLLVISVIMIMGTNNASAAQYAEYPTGWQIIPEECLTQIIKDGKEISCGLDSFVQLFVNLAAIGLKLLPYLAMLMMIWAGFNLIMAGGSPEKIQEGKKMITSIVLGVLIVTILAWAWSLFVVYILTGSAEVFPNTPLHREWWGTGGPAADLPADYGCCYVNFYGCEEMSIDECNSLPEEWQDLGMIPPNVSFLGSASLCSEHPATCENYNYGCCYPNNILDKTCYTPQTNGCLNYKHTRHDNNDCINLTNALGEKVCEDVISGGNLPDEQKQGCCVTPNNCEVTDYVSCLGSFHAGQDCSSVNACTTGCCIGASNCTAGKVNCQGTYDPADCAGLAGCSVGCCVTEASTNYPSCYTNTTEGECSSRAPTDYVLDATADCSGAAVTARCNTGCCYSPCGTTGNIDDSCTNPQSNYEVDCANANRCDIGCCLGGGAVRCTENVERQKCWPLDGDVFLNIGACNPPCTTEGCCMDPTQSYRCIDGYSQLVCETNHLGNLYAGACDTYSDALGHECRLGGSCTVPPAIGVCTDLSPTQTAAYCLISLLGSYDPNPCP